MFLRIIIMNCLLYIIYGSFYLYVYILYKDYCIKINNNIKDINN